MGNFEKLSVLVIVVIIVMILVVALYTWTDGTEPTSVAGPGTDAVASLFPPSEPPPPANPLVKPVEPVIPVQPVVEVKPAEPVAPPVTPPAPETVAPREHVIASGDTLERISKTYYGTSMRIADIEKANPGLDPMRLRVGKKIVIPDVKGEAGKSLLSTEGLERITPSRRSVEPGSTYTVRRGDSLPEIARRAYGKIDRWHEIWLANFDRIDDPDRLATGTRLNLPN